MRRTAAVTAVLIAAGLTTPALAAEAAAPQVQQAKPTWKVSATINAKTVVAGEQKVVVRGRVKPGAAGQKVVLQQKLEKQSRWAKSGVARIKKNGTYKLTDEPQEGGMRAYRVLKPGTDGRKKAYSKELPVTVYAWQDLLGTFAGPQDRLGIAVTSIGTKSYAPSLVQTTAGEPGFAEFTLGRLCTSLKATYALSDASETGSTGTVQVSTDGTSRFAAPFAVGTVAEPVVDLTGVYRLRFDVTSSATPKGVMAVAEPMVLCAK